MAGIFRRAWFPPQKRRFSKLVTTASATLTPNLGAVVATGFQPAVTGGTGVSVTAGFGSVTITGQPVTFGTGTGTTATPGKGSVVVSGFVPSVVSQPPAVTPGKGSVTITGFVPAVTGLASVTLTPGAGRVTFFGHQPNVETGAPVSGGAADQRRKWLDWKARQKKPAKVEIRPVDAIPPGTLSFMELLSFLDAERQAELSRPALDPHEQALDDAEVERLLMEEA